MQPKIVIRSSIPRNATCAALLLLACSFSSAQTSSNPSPPGRMINIGGRMLHLNCSGQGSPTVVLEAGLGDSSLAWALVQPKLATTTRVCSYDRAGTAWSHDAGPQHGLSHAADDLDSLLRISGEHPPYLLVGHSWGGWLITVYGRRHLENVAGIVLVDSSVGFDPPVIEKMPESQDGGPPTGPLIMKKSSDEGEDDPFKRLSPSNYQAYLWTQSLPHLDDVDDPDEPLATVQAATSGKFPLDSRSLVLIVARKADAEYQTAWRGCHVAKAVWNVAGQDRGSTRGNGPALISDMQLVTTIKNIKYLVLN